MCFQPNHTPSHSLTHTPLHLSIPTVCVSAHFSFFIVVVLLLLLFLALAVVLRKGSVGIFSVFLFVWEWDVSLSFTSPTHIITCSFLLFLLCFCHLAFIHLSTAGREVFRSFTEVKAVGEEAACFTSQEGNTFYFYPTALVTSNLSFNIMSQYGFWFLILPFLELG